MKLSPGVQWIVEAVDPHRYSLCKFFILMLVIMLILSWLKYQDEYRHRYE